MDTTVKTLIILDANVDSHHQLLASLQSSEIVRVLDPDRDGVSQITDLLQQYHQEGFRVSLHLVGHGSPGCMTLGSAYLSLETLDCYRSNWQVWAKSVETIALYGCQVAAGDAGAELLSKLHHLTGASLSASSHLVGNADLGGTWDLDWTIGIPSSIPFDRTQLAAYPAVLATFTVTTTNDSGAGSLRQAMLDANATAGLDTIAFSIGTGLQTIVPLTALPAISDPVILDGTTQPGFAGTPIIELNGTNSGGSRGLLLSANNSTIKGLVINRFGGSGILVDGGNNNTIQGSYLGTDVSGTIALGNGLSGVNLQNSANNIVGGTTAAERNLLSGNQNGVLVIGATSTGNQILGNYIGTNASGMAALGNTQEGIDVQSANNTIGGTTPGSGNVISGNGTIGVLLSGIEATANQVLGNLIGINASGTAALGNNFSGVQMLNAPGNTIGGTTAATRNVISGNLQNGVFIRNAGATNNLVTGNFIGTASDGLSPIPNIEEGVQIEDALNNIVGGDTLGAANTIRSNNGSGVLVFGSSTKNAILGNQISNNAALGIDLGNNGSTLNDASDADTGANNLQNFPVLTSAETNGSSTITIAGTLNSTSNTTFTLQFFANTAADPSGYGEGEVFLGSQTVTTDASGNATINAVITAAVTVGQFITATATDPGNNTSEFSAAIATVVATPTADLSVTISDGKTTITPSSALSYTITVTNNGPNTVNSLTLSGVLPPNLTSPIFTPTTGTYNAATGNWTGLTLATGQSTTLTLAGTVNAAATGNLTTTVTVTPPAGTVDGQSGNNTASDTNTILQALTGANPAFDLIKLTDLRNDSRFVGINGSGVGVAVIDTGVDNTHPLLSPNFRTGVDFVNPSYIGDIATHGTHVAGTVGATDLNIGVAPNAGLIGLQVFSSSGLADGTDVNRALEWVLANYEQYNIKVVNMSLGGGVYTSATQAESDLCFQTIKRLEQAGVTVVSSAGNDYVKVSRTKPRNEWGVGAPGIFSSLLVGSVWRDGAATNSLQWGSAPFLGIEASTGGDRLNVFTQRLQVPNMIFAPGANILSTVPVKPGNNASPLAYKGGTSMAAPTVSGAVALLQQAAFEFAGRWYSSEEIISLVRSTADTINDGDDERNNVPPTGENYLRLNVLKAAEAIVQQAVTLGGGTKDANGTILGAYLGPRLDGSNSPTAIKGKIGIDGTAIAVGATDVDLYRFEVLSPGNLTIGLSSDTTNPADFDSYLRLFNSNGTALTADDNGGTGQFSRIANFNIAPGTYFAGVSGVNNTSYNPASAGSGTAGAMGNYQIQFSLTSPDPNGVITGATPVTLTPGTAVTINDAIGTDNGNPVLTVDDVDLYKVTIPDNGRFYIDIDTPVATGFADTLIRLFDKNGNPVTFTDGSQVRNDNGRAVSLTPNANGSFNIVELDDLANPGRLVDPANTFVGHTSDSFLFLNAPKGTVYYIGVSQATTNSYDAKTLIGRPVPSAGGSYNLSLNFVGTNPNSNPTAGVSSTISDVNGSLSLAQGLAVTSLPVLNQSGTIGRDLDLVTGTEKTVGNNDVDFTRINSPTAGVLDLQVTSLDDPNNTDPVEAEILVFDGNGNLLATSADSPLDAGISQGVRDPRLLLPIVANTDYFIAITGIGSENFDPEVMGSGSPGDTGRYLLNAKLISATDAAQFSDNTIDQPGVQAIGVGEVQSGFIGQDGDLVAGLDDVDLYRFVSTLTGTVNIRTNTNQSTDADTVLRVFDAAGNEIAFNDDADNTTISSLITIPVSFGETYYIGVNGYSPQARNYNPITGSGRSAGAVGNYDLEIAPTTLPLPTVLNRLGNDTFRLEGLAGTAQVQATLIGQNPRSLDELSLFTVDDDAGRINGILPGAIGYLQAALQRSQVIFSNLANLPNGTEANSTRSLTLAVGSRLRFFLVKDGTTDGVRSGNILTSNVIFTASSTLQVSQTGTTYSLAWENTPGAGADFQDLVVTLGVVNQPQILGNALQGGQEAELIDLRSVTGSVQASITLTREAAFNNVVGFYTVQNTQGTIADPLTGKLLNPGESGYLEAAVRNRISNLDMTVTNQSSATFTSQFSGGTLLAPFIIANSAPAALLDNNPANDPAVYVPFLAANPGRVDHLRLLGDNRFGFEDLPSGGDFDYNDIVMKVSLQVV